MPKQVWKIERFDGGLNTNSDPRDIADNELAEAIDIMVDNVGKIRTLGGTATHGQVGAVTHAVEAGYGMFQFSHDRTGANVMSADYSGTHTAADHGTIMTDGAANFPVDALIGATINNTTDGSSGVITDNTAVTVTTTLSGGSDDSWDTSDAYTITAFPETGDDYLAIADADSASNIDIYSKNSDTWGYGNIDLGSTTGMKTVFYQADGSLRVSDANFGAANQNKWYGYIERQSFVGDNVTTTVSTNNSLGMYDGWYSKSLDLPKPTAGLYGVICAYEDDGTHGTPAEYNTVPSAGGTNVFTKAAGLFSTTYAADAGAGTLYVCTDSGSNEGTGHARDIRSASGNILRTITSNAGGGWGGDKIRIYPPVGTGWGIYCHESTTAGSWPAGNYWIGITFIYVGNQESQVYDLKTYGGSGVTGAVELNGGFAVEVGVNAHAPYDEFITGGRAYIRKKETDDPWIFLVDISIADGVRTDLTSAYTHWFHDDSSDSQTSDASLAAPDAKYLWVGGDATATAGTGEDFLVIKNPSPWTYETINGYNPSESIDIGAVGEGFKTAVVANRQTYIGNVRREGKDGITRTEGDAMYKSMPGKFDIFPIARKIEASVQDGDQIVKLEEYADRILQFKKTKMHLINISQDVEFLEDTFMHKGILHAASSCKTDFGIAWANREGCYLYDGKNVINLLEKKGRQIIKESEWDKFLRHDKSLTGTRLNPMIGYVPKKRQLIVVDDITNTSTADPRMYLYDMVTQSWVKGANDSSSRQIDYIKTNFTIDWNNDLIYNINASNVVKWDDTSDITDTISFKTKDIDFGNPAVRKKVYKAYISYKGDGDSVTIQYSINGDTDTVAPFYRTTADGSSDKTNSDTTPLLDSNTDDWILAELRPVTSINNVYSFQLIFDGTAGLDFEINDISIVYRIKNIK